MNNDFIVWSPGVTLESIEKEVILRAFRFYRGNKTATSSALGIAIRTLDNKLEKYEVDGKSQRERNEQDDAKRAEFLARQRGGNPAPAATNAKAPQMVTGGSHGAATGERLEPATKLTEKPPVPLPKRAEVQSVLPQQNAPSNSRKAR